MSFFTNLIGEHVNNAGNAIQTALIKADISTASEAEIKTIFDAVSEDNLKLSQLTIDLEAIKAKVASDQKEVDDHSKAVEILAAKPETAEKATKLMDELEKLSLPKLAADKARLATLNQSLAQYTTHKLSLEKRLAEARNNLENNKAQLDQAKLDLQQAKEEKADAERTVGLSKTLDGLHIASDSMAKAAAEARLKADAARRDTASLQNLTPSSGDKDIQEALAQARGEANVSNESVADRLARIRAKATA